MKGTTDISEAPCSSHHFELNYDAPRHPASNIGDDHPACRISPTILLGVYMTSFPFCLFSIHHHPPQTLPKTLPHHLQVLLAPQLRPEPEPSRIPEQPRERQRPFCQYRPLLVNACVSPSHIYSNELALPNATLPPPPPCVIMPGTSKPQERPNGKRTGPPDRAFPLRRLSSQAQPAGPREGPKQTSHG